MIVMQGAIKLPNMLSGGAPVGRIIYETTKLNLEKVFCDTYLFINL